ncbi:MAG: DNA glycosylase AlkZ-like family protein [Holdemania filiformis]
MRTLTKEQVLRCQRHAHHLDKKLPREQRLEAVSACGLVNSPPGSWELALAVRVAALTRDDLRCDLIETKNLMQTWSLRGAPTIFPTAEAGTFLSALAAQPDEVPVYAQPLSYTAQALEAQRHELLEALRQACAVLEHKTIVGKAQLDHDLAEAMKSFQDGPRPCRRTVAGGRKSNAAGSGRILFTSPVRAGRARDDGRAAGKSACVYQPGGLA